MNKQNALSDWSPDSWRSKPAEQQVEYDDDAELHAALDQIRVFPPIVTSWEVERLKSQLAEVARGERFLLQGGDCSERFSDCQSRLVDAKLKILLTMSAVLMYGGGKQVVRVGRIAGQYAKPRSSPTETRDGQTLCSFRGDLINRTEFTPEARRPDPRRLVEGYSRASLTLNFIRSLLSGGFGDIHNTDAWDLSFIEHADQPQEYERIIDGIRSAVRFLDASVGRTLGELRSPDFFTSHEGLHLEFEQACTELPPLRDRWYDLSCHLPWIGNRTRDPGGAHIEFFRGIANPVGIKLGPGMDPQELVALMDRLDPEREPGKLVLIVRMGADRVADGLPPLVDAVMRADRTPVWCSDPMHGNTYATADGVKTRHFDAILRELEQTFEIHADCGSHLGGVHFEMTGQDVTEVVGGARGLSEKDLHRCYDSDVDPRLNYEQALEMSLLIAHRMRSER
ncbi:MAG: 3-deoxy-7-phosphoheptulonate synthase [Alphaproteobacteria bacterium]|nr:3-deoxy-7-phosphoheptulonate synthase [Alphaproteobacteria bacterium]